MLKPARPNQNIRIHTATEGGAGGGGIEELHTHVPLTQPIKQPAGNSCCLFTFSVALAFAQTAPNVKIKAFSLDWWVLRVGGPLLEKFCQGVLITT